MLEITRPGFIDVIKPRQGISHSLRGARPLLLRLCFSPWSVNPLELQDGARLLLHSGRCVFGYVKVGGICHIFAESYEDSFTMNEKKIQVPC